MVKSHEDAYWLKNLSLFTVEYIIIIVCISFTVLEQFTKVVWRWTFLMSGLDDKKLVALVNTDIINNILNLLMANT